MPQHQLLRILLLVGSGYLGLFVKMGCDVFSPRALPSGHFARMVDMSRSVLGLKYSVEALRAVLTETLGRRTLGEALHHIVVPAVNVTHSLTKVFKTKARGDEWVSAVDVAMATSAALAYFPSVRIGDDLFADGAMEQLDAMALDPFLRSAR